MRSLNNDVLAQLQDRQSALVARDFLNVWPKNRSTGAEVEKGYWSDHGVLAAPVINPLTGSSVTRTFRGVGTLIRISDIPLVSNVTVRAVQVVLSQIDTDVEAALRTFDLRQARIEIFRGIFNPGTRALIDSAVPRFVGFVDTVEVETPSENEEGGVTLNCVSHTQEMLRSNPELRSDESQKRRSATDNFYQDVATVGDWEQFWGRNTGKVA